MKKQRKWLWLVVGGMVLLGIVCALPPVSSRVFARIDQVRLWVFYKINPPEEQIFTPGQQGRVEAIVQATMTALVPSNNENGMPSYTATPSPEPTYTLKPDEPTPTPLPPSPTPTLPPSSALIKDVPYVDQHFGQNECAPANLAMALKFWGWTGSRESLSKFVKPFERDKNVMPYELAGYVNSQTEFKAIVRIGGTPLIIKSLVSSGYPVIVERGVYLRDLSGKISWMGHYQVVYGYDDAAQIFNVKDSFEAGGENFKVSYEDLVQGWRSFNYTFIVVYPPDHQAQVLQAMGQYADENLANRLAYQIASEEIPLLEGQDLFFSWFNRGSSMVQLQDYFGAAQAYDQAFMIYADLPADRRPWRVTWYQTGPYFAYYYSNRYNDVLSLADTTISSASDPFLEENFYWRAKAKSALGDVQGAVADLRKSLEYHPGFTPSLEELRVLGYEP